MINKKFIMLCVLYNCLQADVPMEENYSHIDFPTVQFDVLPSALENPFDSSDDEVPSSALVYSSDSDYEISSNAMLAYLELEEDNMDID